MKSGQTDWFLVAATLTLLLAAFFRLWLLLDVPPGLAQDEVLDAGMPAFILAGNHAFFFREGYGHEPLYHYWTIPFSLLLGENAIAVRFPSVVLGLLLVALAMRWVKREFGAGTAVITGLGLAISWWPIIFSRIGIRPILEPVLLLIFAWFWPKRPFMAGLFLGLSLYSYTGARVVFAIPGLMALYFFFTQRQQQVKAALVVLGMALLVSAPMFLTLWADPSLQQRVDQLAGPLEALQAGNPQPILQSIVQTLGVFSFTGDPRWTYTWPNRPLFDWGTAVFFYSGFLLAVRYWRQPRYTFVLIWLGVTLIPSAVTPQAPSTVRLLGGLPVVYLLVALGGTAVYYRMKSARWFANQKVIMPPILLLLALSVVGVNLFRTVNDGFIRWPQAEKTRLEHYQTVLLDIARHWQANPAANMVIADPFFEPIDRDSLIFSLGSDPQARWVQTGDGLAGALVLPVGGDGRFYVPEFAPIHPWLMRAAGLPLEPYFRSEAQPAYSVYRLDEAQFLPATSLEEPISFENLITLEGYSLLRVEPDEELNLLTFWRVEDKMPRDLKAFVHVVDSSGNLVAQHDGFDAAAEALKPGDRVIQRHIINLTELTGYFELQVGLYTFQSQQRLQPGDVGRDIVVLAEVLFVDGK